MPRILGWGHWKVAHTTELVYVPLARHREAGVARYLVTTGRPDLHSLAEWWAPTVLRSICAIAAVGLKYWRKGTACPRAMRARVLLCVRSVRGEALDLPHHSHQVT